MKKEYKKLKSLERKIKWFQKNVEVKPTMSIDWVLKNIIKQHD